MKIIGLLILKIDGVKIVFFSFELYFDFVWKVNNIVKLIVVLVLLI